MKKHTVYPSIAMFLMLILSVCMLFGCKKEKEDDYIPPPKSFPGYRISSPSDLIEVGKSVSFSVIPACPQTALWDFGDGTTSTYCPGSHMYLEPGYYTVSMIPNGDSSKIQKTEVRVRCFVNMKYSGNCVVGDSIQFFNTCSELPTSTYLWDFGDNTTSTEPAPKHAYAAVSFYTVRLTVNGFYTTTKTLNIYP